jgi:hypothetical protein
LIIVGEINAEIISINFLAKTSIKILDLSKLKFVNIKGR